VPAVPAGPAPPGRFQIRLIFRLTLVGLILMQGTAFTQERLAMVVGALLAIYLFQVGVFPDLFGRVRTLFGRGVVARAQAGLVRRRRAEREARREQQQGRQQGANGDAPAAAAAPEPEIVAPDIKPYTATLLLGQGSRICDLFALVAAFFISLLPHWLPEQELLPHAPVEGA
jgi:hypothetical protein